MLPLYELLNYLAFMEYWYEYSINSPWLTLQVYFTEEYCAMLFYVVFTYEVLYSNSLLQCNWKLGVYIC